MEESRETQKRKLQEAQGYPAPNFNKLVEGHKDYDSEFQYTLNYTNYMYQASDLKKHTEEWLNRKFNHIPDYKFVGIGQIAWILNHSGYVKPDVIQRTSEKVNKLSIEDAEQETVKVSEIKSSQNNLQTRTNKVIAELNVYIDDGLLERDIEKTAKEILADQGSFLQQPIRDFVEEWKKSVNTDSVMSLTEKGKMLHHIELITQALDYVEVQPKVKRASVRTPKPKDPSKLVKKLNYLQSFPELELASISPEGIIRAEVLWVYNVKTRKLGQYIAQNESGLSVKGSKIVNFDETKSVQKTLRKPKDILTKVENSGKLTQRKILEDIKAVEGMLSGRVNKDTILVKIF